MIYFYDWPATAIRQRHIASLTLSLSPSPSPSQRPCQSQSQSRSRSLTHKYLRPTHSQLADQTSFPAVNGHSSDLFFVAQWLLGKGCAKSAIRMSSNTWRDAGGRRRRAAQVLAVAVAVAVALCRHYAISWIRVFHRNQSTGSASQ